MQSGEIKKYYRWNQTSRKGQVEEYMAETNDAVYFTSSRFCSKEQWDYGYLDPISEEEFNQYSPPDTNDAYPNPDIVISETEFNTIAGNTIEHHIQIPIIEKSPIRLILDKQKKTSPLESNILLQSNIPTDKVFELLTVMFDEEEVIDEIINLVFDTVDIKLIEEELKKQLKSNIYSYYKIEENVTSSSTKESISELVEEK